MSLSYHQLEERNQELERQNQVLVNRNQELEDKVGKLHEILKKALERITELEESLKLNSKNSSKPPSTDRKANSNPRPKKQRGSRKGYSRKLAPPERVDEHVTCHLEECPHCSSHNLKLREGATETLQQVELPEVRAKVTEYLIEKYRCTTCGKKCSAELPEGVPDSTFGPRMMGFLATVTGVFQLAKREAIELIADVYKIDLGVGSVPNIEERVTKALNPCYERIHHFILQGGLTKHFDETGWRDSGSQHYAWIACTEEAVLFRIDRHRSGEAFENLVCHVTDFNAVTDRYAVYKRIKGVHQYCLAHLIRDFRKYADRNGSDGEIGNAVENELAGLCRVQREYREGKRNKKSRNVSIGHSKRRIKDALIDGIGEGSDDLSSLCDRLYDESEHLWAFSKIEGMDPTNNLAERNLRKLVLWRKKSYGTRSDRGMRFVERITTVSQTLRKHGINVLEFIQKAVVNRYLGVAPPDICANFTT